MGLPGCGKPWSGTRSPSARRQTRARAAINPDDPGCSYLSAVLQEPEINRLGGAGDPQEVRRASVVWGVEGHDFGYALETLPGLAEARLEALRQNARKV